MTPLERCPDCGNGMSSSAISCMGCGWRRHPPENALPPHPAGVDELALRVNAAVLTGKLRWSDVSRSTSMSTGDLANLLQGRTTLDWDSRQILEVILKDCEGA